MAATNLIQIIAAAIGVIGSLFFSIGILRQSPATMANLAGTYFDWNPHMIPALAAQKADYVFGGATIVLAFCTQLISFLVDSTSIVVGARYSSVMPWIVIVATAMIFPALRRASKLLAGHYEEQINQRLRERAAAAMRELEARQAAVALQTKQT